MCHILHRPDQVFWLWTRRSDPVWYQKWPLHRQRIPRGEQVAGHAWWVHQKICAVSRVWQPWNWSGNYFIASGWERGVLTRQSAGICMILPGISFLQLCVCLSSSMSTLRNKPSATLVRPVAIAACLTPDTNSARSSLKTHQVNFPVALFPEAACPAHD